MPVERCEPTLDHHSTEGWHWVKLTGSGVLMPLFWRNGAWCMGGDISPETAAKFGYRYVEPIPYPTEEIKP